MGFLGKALETASAVKTKLFGDLNDSQPHGFWAGFVPTFAPSLVAAGAIVLGTPVGVVVALAGVAVAAGVAGVVGALAIDGVAVGLAANVAGVTGATAVLAGGLGAGGVVGLAAALAGGCTVGAFASALFKKERSYCFLGRYLAGEGAGCLLGVALVFNVTAGHLPQEQPKAPVAGPVPSTLHIESRGGELCKNFNVAETTDAQERTVFILTVPKGCTVPAAAAAVPR